MSPSIRMSCVLVVVCALSLQLTPSSATAAADVNPKSESTQMLAQSPKVQQETTNLTEVAELIRQLYQGYAAQWMRRPAKLEDSKSTGQKQEEGGNEGLPQPEYDTMLASQTLVVLLGPVLRLLQMVPLLGIVAKLINGIARGAKVQDIILNLVRCAVRGQCKKIDWDQLLVPLS